jgi:hypothetical protein
MKSKIALSALLALAMLITTLTPALADAATNSAPQITSMSWPETGVIAGEYASFSASFVDPDINDTHAAVWQFAPGVYVAGTVEESNGVGTVSGVFQYNEIGVLSFVTLVVSDEYGASDIAYSGHIAVYDPHAGFVTGSGWMDSPIRAFIADPTLTGKAKFSFDVKYANSVNQPTGQMSFDFDAGNLHYRSTSCEWLVVGVTATNFESVGSINGVPGYHCQMTVRESSGNRQLTVRIWSLSSDGFETFVYNGGRPRTIGGGHFVVHEEPGSSQR